jgi:hypothetical protein
MINNKLNKKEIKLVQKYAQKIKDKKRTFDECFFISLEIMYPEVYETIKKIKNGTNSNTIVYDCIQKISQNE